MYIVNCTVDVQYLMWCVHSMNIRPLHCHNTHLSPESACVLRMFLTCSGAKNQQILKHTKRK